MSTQLPTTNATSGNHMLSNLKTNYTDWEVPLLVGQMWRGFRIDKNVNRFAHATILQRPSWARSHWMGKAALSPHHTSYKTSLPHLFNVFICVQPSEHVSFGCQAFIEVAEKVCGDIFFWWAHPNVRRGVDAW